MSKNKPSKAAKGEYEEKIVNDFLLQFTYSIFSAMLLMYIYNGRMFKYGNGIGVAMPAIIWTLFGIFAVLGILFVWKYKTKGKAAHKTAAIYLLISCAGMFWCIGFEGIMDLFNIRIPFYNAKHMMLVLFGIIGASAVAELAVYFIRYARLKKM